MTNENVSLSSAHERFLKYLKAQNRSASTILAYGKDITQLIAFLEEKKITQLEAVTPEVLNLWKEDFSQKNYTQKSIARKLNSAKTFFRFLISQGILEENPALSVSHPKYQTTPPRVLSKIEYRALRDACRQDERMAAIVELMLQTGIRIGELARLEIPDVKKEEIFIRKYESQPARTIPLNKPARMALDRYLQKRPKTKSKALFVTKNGKPFLVRNIRTTMERFFKIAGIEKAKINDLRNTWIVHQLNEGVSPLLLQKLAGHKRLSTTEKYLQFVEKRGAKEKVKLEEL